MQLYSFCPNSGYGFCRMGDSAEGAARAAWEDPETRVKMLAAGGGGIFAGLGRTLTARWTVRGPSSAYIEARGKARAGELFVFAAVERSNP